MIAKGKSINVTLIFSLERYAEVAEAYIRGLERLVAHGGDPSTVASVASFFVSRVDTEADRRLDELGGHDDLKGKLAIANAKLAYQRYQELFSGRALGVPGRQGRDAAALPLGLDLDEEPGLPRRPLRRGADRPRYRRTRCPRRRFEAFQDHGRVAPTLAQGIDEAERVFERLAAAGVDYDDVTDDARAGGRREVRGFLRGAARRDPRLHRRAEGRVTPCRRGGPEPVPDSRRLRLVGADPTARACAR